MCSEKQAASQFTALQIDPDELASWRAVRDDCFDWVKRLVHYLPRGKAWVPRRLGRTVFKNTKGVILMTSGVRLAVEPYHLDAYVSRSIVSGCVVTEMCQRTLNPGECFFDIGASIGSVSLAVAKAFEDRVHIHAFEPQASIACCTAICAALEGLRNFAVYQTLVGEKDGEADLFLADSSTHVSRYFSDRTLEKVRCRMISIDQQIQLGALPPPNVVKVDVEGAEFQVFKGMEHLIRTDGPVIVFEADANLGRFGKTPSQLLEYLKSLYEYDFYLLHPEPNRRERITRIEDFYNQAVSGNILAVPTEDIEIKRRLPLTGMK